MIDKMYFNLLSTVEQGPLGLANCANHGLAIFYRAPFFICQSTNKEEDEGCFSYSLPCTRKYK